MKPIEGIFGKHSWADLRSEVTARVRSRYRQVPLETVEDAVSEAVSDLLEYWVWLPSSVVDGNPNLTFRGALTRANHKASEYILRELNRPDSVTFTDLQAELDDPDAEGFNDYLDGLMADQAPDPGEGAEEDDLKARARRMLDDLSEEELESWGASYFNGETVRECEARTGVSRSVIDRRRQVGLARLRERAHEYGIS